MGDDGSENGSDCSYHGDADEFWGGALDSRIVRVGNAPPQRHSGRITSSIEALDKKRRMLQAAIDTIRHRCDSEEKALRNIIHTLREHRAREEQAIESSIATINYHYNALIPMARPPPKILSRILVFHAQLDCQRLNAISTSICVCKWWRQIGLSCPELWSHIVYRRDTSVVQMATMIERSRSVPLSLVIDDGADLDSRKMSLVAKNLHRVKFFGFLKPSIAPRWQSVKQDTLNTVYTRAHYNERHMCS